jgi:hypothetical protein
LLIFDYDLARRNREVFENRNSRNQAGRRNKNQKVTKNFVESEKNRIFVILFGQEKGE